MILQTLKQRTRAHHARAEARVPLLRPEPTLGEYRATLAAFYGFYVPVEAALAIAAARWALPVDVATRAKAHLLARDLRALACDDAAIATLPLCTAIPAIQSPADALGMLYVLEGATLGGRFVERHLARALAVAGACSFYACYGDQVGPMWRAFGIALAAHVRQHANGEDVVSAACATFDALDRWLAAQLPVASLVPHATVSGALPRSADRMPTQ